MQLYFNYRLCKAWKYEDGTFVLTFDDGAIEHFQDKRSMLQYLSKLRKRFGVDQVPYQKPKTKPRKLKYRRAIRIKSKS